MKEGISLLSLKHQTLLSYIQSLLLLSARRTLGHTFTERSTPSESFGSSERTPRGDGAGDLIDSMIEGRLVLEKVKVLESRMKYQIDKLVKVAQEPVSKHVDAADDPLAFRPNPENFADASEEEGSDNEDASDLRHHDKHKDGIYRPPRLAPVPYTVTSGKSKKERNRAPIPSALSSLLESDPSMPHAESSSGLGNTPAFASGRARYLERLKDYEESNFTRLFMKKKDAKQRLRDEEDLALGGTLSSAGRGGKNRRKGGFEDEFGDVLKAAERPVRNSGFGDGYEELRQRGKKRSVLERSRSRIEDGGMANGFEDGSLDGQRRKRTRFEEQAKKTRKKLGRSRR
ncbi:hypothetical protein DL96DRAFT_1578798 [Flagelloscypha sp. PMI_526]|nr:hypothetical protein DL96DRAFT_1578798 [Flagelloscypha sp. PMI_526]